MVVRRTWAGRTAWRIVESLTGEVVDHVIAQPTPWHRRQSTGDIITRAGVDAEAATAVLQPLPFASSVVVMLVLSAVWLVVTDPILGVAAVCVFPLLIGLNLIYQRRVNQYFNVAQVEIGKLSAAVHESFDGVNVVKAFGAESRETERLAVIASRLREARSEHRSAAQHVRGAARRRAQRRQHPAAHRRRVPGACGRPDRRRADQLHLPVHPAWCSHCD